MSIEAAAIKKNKPKDIKKVHLRQTAHLIHCQVDAGIRNDAQHVGDVAFVKCAKSFSPENLLCTI